MSVTTAASPPVLTDEEREALDAAADKCHLEAERLVALDHGDAANLDGIVALVVMWARYGDVLRALLGRTS